MTSLDHRLERIDAALCAAYDRIGELDGHRPPEGGRLLPTDTEAANCYGKAATLAEALAIELRMAEEAFRPQRGALNRRRGGGA